MVGSYNAVKSKSIKMKLFYFYITFSVPEIRNSLTHEKYVLTGCFVFTKNVTAYNDLHCPILDE